MNLVSANGLDIPSKVMCHLLSMPTPRFNKISDHQIDIRQITKLLMDNC